MQHARLHQSPGIQRIRDTRSSGWRHMSGFRSTRPDWSEADFAHQFAYVCVAITRSQRSALPGARKKRRSDFTHGKVNVCNRRVFAGHGQVSRNRRIPGYPDTCLDSGINKSETPVSALIHHSCIVGSIPRTRWLLSMLERSAHSCGLRQAGRENQLRRRSWTPRRQGNRCTA